MRRILFISPAANLGGAERCLLETLKCLDPEQFEVHVLFLEDGPLQEAVLAHVAGVEILPLPKSYHVQVIMAVVLSTNFKLG